MRIEWKTLHRVRVQSFSFFYPANWGWLLIYFLLPSADASSLGIFVVSVAAAGCDAGWKSDLWVVSLQSFKQLFVVMVFWQLPGVKCCVEANVAFLYIICSLRLQDAAMFLCRHTTHYIQHVEWTPSWVSHIRNHNDWRNTQGTNNWFTAWFFVFPIEVTSICNQPWAKERRPSSGIPMHQEARQLKLVLSGIVCFKLVEVSTRILEVSRMCRNILVYSIY